MSLFSPSLMKIGSLITSTGAASLARATPASSTSKARSSRVSVASSMPCQVASAGRSTARGV